MKLFSSARTKRMTIQGTLLTALTFSAVLSTAIAQTIPRPNADGRTEPFTLDYSKGRTWQAAYEKDPNSRKELLNEADLNRVCWKSKAFDFETGSLDRILSDRYLENPTYKEFDIIVHVSIPLQKMFVLDRQVYERTQGRRGLKYAWNTSTGYHDKHYSYRRKAGKYVFGQKGTVQITHRDKADALSHLQRIARKPGAKLLTEGKTQKVIFEGSGKSVFFTEQISKMKKERALRSGLPLLGEDPDLPGFYRVKRYSLNYTEYYHTQPGYYVVQNGFSSRNISGESDGSYDVEQPTMPWALFFNQQRGMAVHGAAYRGSMGSPNSHGCVRLLEENACRLFHLVGQRGRAEVPFVNEKTGAVSQRKRAAYPALVVVTDQVSEAEKRHFGLE